MTTRIFRLLLGAFLPIPMMVALFIVICDSFYFNKDEDCIRLSDMSVLDNICLFVYYSIIVSEFFGIPCLLYSVLLEWRRSCWKTYLLVSLGFGAFFGFCVGCMTIPPFRLCKSSDFAEGSLHFFASLLVVGVVVPAVLRLFR